MAPVYALSVADDGDDDAKCGVATTVSVLQGADAPTARPSHRLLCLSACEWIWCVGILSDCCYCGTWLTNESNDHIY